MSTDYDRARALKLVRSHKILKKVWDKVPPRQNQDAALESIFNALVAPDREMMDLYAKTV